MMKRIVAILCAALLLTALASGCKKDEPAVVLVTDEETTVELWTYPTLPEEETEPVEPTDAEPEQAEPTAASTTTTRTTTTSKVPVLSGNASASTPTTTTSAATTTTTTRQNANAISINSREDALGAFNSAVQKATGGKAGFAKSHLITAQDWTFDQAFLDTLPSLGGLIDPGATLSSTLNAALGKGMRTATATKGSANSLLTASAFTMADMKDVTWSASSGVTTVTLSVKDGETRQEKRLFGNNRSTGASPIDKGPLGMATGSAGLYDHMDADKIFGLVKSSFSIVNAEPIDIQESTSQVKFVAKLDGQGRLIELKATFNQTINLKDIRILNGAQAFRDNKSSSTVTVTYDNFMY